MMKIICPKMIDSLLAQMIIKCQILLSFSRSKINVLNLGTEPVCLPANHWVVSLPNTHWVVPLPNNRRLFC